MKRVQPVSTAETVPFYETEPADSFTGSEARADHWRDPTDRTMFDWEVQCHPNFVPRWSSGKRMDALKAAGYGCVYRQHLVTHAEGLAETEVRIMNGIPSFDAAGRVKNGHSEQFLMLVPRRRWEQLQELKTVHALNGAGQQIKGNIAEDLERIRDKSARDRLMDLSESETGLRQDTNVQL